ncbi:MAG: hypothetical protein NTX82_04500 [Candidatus Parcubacteria bacterium]|nr:hypothetical protein [Candidatus Parcubacteria bacterium]
MAIGMMMCCRPALQQEIRLEQRLMLRLEQRLVLAQRLVDQLGLLNEGNKDVLYEIFQLERYQEMLKTGNFHSLEEWKLFLAKESQSKTVLPEFSQHGSLSPKKRNKVLVPELAIALLGLINLYHQDLILGETQLSWDQWQRQVIDYSLKIGQTGEKPSETWQQFLQATAKKTADQPEQVNDFSSAFWNLLNQVKDKGDLEITASLDLIVGFLNQLDLQQTGSLIKFISQEIKDQSHGMIDLKGDLRELSDLTQLDAIKFAIKIILQAVRYKTGSRFDGGANTGRLEMVLKQPALIDFLNGLTDLPQVMGMTILTGYNFEQEAAIRLIKQLDQLAADKHFQKSRDDKRLMWRFLTIMRFAYQPDQSLQHFFSIATNTEEMLRGFQAIEKLALQNPGKLPYPLEATSMQDLISWGENSTRRKYQETLGFTQEEMDLLTQDEVYRLVTRNDLLKMVMTYAALCKANGYEPGAKLASEILRQAMYKHFERWRYSHEQSQKQIGFLSDITPWRDEHKRTMIVGLSDAFEQRLAAIKRLVSELAVLWQKQTGQAITADIDGESEELYAKLRSKSLTPEERKQIGARVGQIKKEYALIHVLKDLLKLSPESVNYMKGINYHLGLVAEKLNTDEARMLVKAIIELINATDINAISYLTFEDSDRPYELMQVGVSPIQSCQRWYEWTCHNRCLTAYVVDANKKVLWVKNNHFDIIGRCILRLLPYEYGKTDKETIPLLIIERPYSKAWSKEIGIGILQWLVEKAGQISKANDLPVLVAIKDPQLVATLKEVLPKSKISTRTLRLELPPSLNEFEYSDSMGGDLKSGAKIVDKEFHTFFVGDASDED